MAKVKKLTKQEKKTSNENEANSAFQWSPDSQIAISGREFHLLTQMRDFLDVFCNSVLMRMKAEKIATPISQVELAQRAASVMKENLEKTSTEVEEGTKTEVEITDVVLDDSKELKVLNK